MPVTSALNVQGQQHNSPGSHGNNPQLLFPRKDLAAYSHTFDVNNEPVIIVAGGFPVNTECVLQISTDRVAWSDWNSHGSAVVLSAANSMQRIVFTGQYRLLLRDITTKIPYIGVTQPSVRYYAATSTHEQELPLVGAASASSTVVLLKKFRSIQPLVAGSTVVTHNLALTAFEVMCEVRDPTTGDLIDVSVSLETANTVTITTGASVASAQITIIG
jgi:hypothetical protein